MTRRFPRGRNALAFEPTFDTAPPAQGLANAAWIRYEVGSPLTSRALGTVSGRRRRVGSQRLGNHSVSSSNSMPSSFQAFRTRLRASA